MIEIIELGTVVATFLECEDFGLDFVYIFSAFSRP